MATNTSPLRGTTTSHITSAPAIEFCTTVITGLNQRLATLVRATLVARRDASSEHAPVPDATYPMDFSPGIFIPTARIRVDDAAHGDDATADYVSTTYDTAADVATSTAASTASVTVAVASTASLAPLFVVATFVTTINGSVNAPVAASILVMGRTATWQSTR